MKHLQALLLLVVLTASGVAAEGPAPTYRAPRAHDGHPDLQGVWNFASGVPLQRRAAFGDRKLMTKEEFDKERAALLSALGAAAKFAPVENVGFDWIDFSLHVDDLRTSLMTHPDNGRLPALVAGVRRVTTVADILAALADPRDAPQGGLPSLLADFDSGGIARAPRESCPLGDGRRRSPAHARAVSRLPGRRAGNDFPRSRWARQGRSED
jgi:hypothetical protein